ncbi:MAG: hypothetical protein WC401_04595 [Bacteroidales bacterium]
MDIYVAKEAKSSGTKIREITGEKNNGISWAITVPVIRVRTSLI